MKTTCFHPGKHLVIDKDMCRTALPKYKQAYINVPGRLHFTVLDFNKMIPGMGGGGLGASVSTTGQVIEIVIGNENAFVDNTDLQPTAQHIIDLFKQCVAYEKDDIHIRVSKKIEHAHAGFGSNVCFNTALLAGLNAMFGSPFSTHELWHLSTRNFVENSKENDQQVYLGFGTGVGDACILYGGLVWVDDRDQGRYLGSLNCDDLWVVTGVVKLDQIEGELIRKNPQQHKNHDKDISENTEADIVANECQRYQEEYGTRLATLLENMQIPFLENDQRAFLALAQQLNEVGDMKVLEKIYNKGILNELEAAMHQNGALFASMSSAGPGYFAFAASEAEATTLKDILEKRFDNLFSSLAIGKVGERVSIKLGEKV